MKERREGLGDDFERSTGKLILFLKERHEKSDDDCRDGREEGRRFVFLRQKNWERGEERVLIVKWGEVKRKFGERVNI